MKNSYLQRKAESLYKHMFQRYAAIQLNQYFIEDDGLIQYIETWLRSCLKKPIVKDVYRDTLIYMVCRYLPPLKSCILIEDLNLDIKL